MRTVVLGYDGSHAARRALHGAVAAAGKGGRVVVVTAAPPPDELLLEHLLDPPSLHPQELLDEAVILLAEHDVDIVARIVEADPVEALIEVARETDAAMIVVGARGDSFVERALRGSVSERLVKRAPCHLLVAH